MTPRAATRDEVIATVRALPAGTRFVGIDGFGGAGKTVLAADVADRVPGITVVHADDFSSVAVHEWDWQRLQDQVLDPLLAGRPGRYQRWDYFADTGAEWHDVPVGRIVVIEGVSATRRELRLPWDLRVWVDTPVDVRLDRARARDGEQAVEWWRTRWIPEEQGWFRRDPAYERADLVVDGTA